MIDDKDQSLLKLSQRDRTSIISQLVEISSEHNQQEHSKLRRFISNLQCLWPEDTRLYRTSIDAFRMRHYVALSYTWDASDYEDKKSKKYCVERWSGNRFQRSKVRNCVFDRILRYMRHAAIRLLWIDRHCIHQDTCKKGACSHSHCAQNRQNIQAMDLVYQLSEHPVALLGRPLWTRAELQLLTRILSGELVDTSKFLLLEPTNLCEATEALWLLHEITRDNWWRRAWTFQENYRGGTRMRLLIRHNPLLEQQKLQHRMFGEIPGELCVESVSFSDQATRLCLELRKAARQLSRDDVSRIDSVLRATGRYAVMLSESSSMTPAIITDIEARGMAEPWDRLAIVANCCQYSVRLDHNALRQQRCSLSLSLLAMCLLNGEILDNRNDGLASVADLTVSKFLESQMFRAFSAPKNDFRRLTFNKGCRLTYAKLTAAGIMTSGHLWKLGRIINTAKFARELPWIDEPSGRLALEQRRRLLQLVFRLPELGHRPYADRIDKYLDFDADVGYDYASFADKSLHRMAEELAGAIKAGKKLRLGRIWDLAGRSAPGHAIFVWSGEDGDGAYPAPPAFVFTATRRGDPGSGAQDANDLDRHVSLSVDLEAPSGGGVPHLLVRNWLLGMCFFDGCPLTSVVFPWPRALQEIEP